MTKPSPLRARILPENPFRKADNLPAQPLRIDSVAMSAADEGAFRAFALTRRPSLRRTAFLLCGDWHQADDLVQSALVKLYVAWPRIRATESPDGYTHRILVRCYLDERRRPWRRESPVDLIDDHAAAACPTDEVLDLRAALARLPRRQRATLLLRFWLDASVTQTADALGCSEGTVKSQTARTVSALRNLLGENALVTEESS
jgi:RNA polymerase sigma-70 factor (sigma-E family)